MKSKIPTWLTGMTALVLLSNLFVFGLFAFVNPGAVFPDLNEAAEYPARFFAIRHIAFSLPLLHGLLTQNRVVLSAMYHMFLVIAVLDVGSVLYFGWSYPFIGPLSFGLTAVVGSLVFIVPMTIAVIYLRKNSN